MNASSAVSVLLFLAFSLSHTRRTAVSGEHSVVSRPTKPHSVSVCVELKLKVFSPYFQRVDQSKGL